MIDLRSDTVTKPSAPMLEAIACAQVGDDVFSEDPSINELEAYSAQLFKRDAALFCPSGTMANQIAIKCHTQPGDEVICEQMSHVYIYEAGGIAFHSLCSIKPLIGNRGRLTANQIEAAINPNDIHKPVTRLVSLENTANRGGGSCYDITELQSIKSVCLNNNLKLHLDGARLWNALIARNEEPEQYGEIFDSISVCLSKGLGAPVGSVLIGDHAFIKQAHRYRKLFGGGMRQAGFLAAAGSFALKNQFQRLATDHSNAKMIAELLVSKPWVSNIIPVETNILIFEVKDRFTANSFIEYLKTKDILAFPISENQIRFVFHIDISDEKMQQLFSLLKSL